MPSNVGANLDLIAVARKGTLAAGAYAAQAEDAGGLPFIVADDKPDMYGDSFDTNGLNLPAQVPAFTDHQHDVGHAVGSWTNIRRAADGRVLATLKLLSKGVSRMADLVRALHAEGHQIASSVFVDVPLKDIEPILKNVNGRQVQVGRRFKSGLLREITLTLLPANPRAVSIARSMGFTDDELAALSRTEPDTVVISRATSAVAGASTSPPVSAPKGRAMNDVNLAEMISVARAALDAAQQAHESALGAMNDTPESVEAISRSTTALEAARTRVDTLVAAEQARASRATASPQPGASIAAPQLLSQQPNGQYAPVARSAGSGPAPSLFMPAAIQRAPAIVHPGALKNEPAGMLFSRIVVARHQSLNRHIGLHEAAEQFFGDRPEVIAVARSAVGVADTTTAGWAAELVKQDVRMMMEEDLVPISVFAALSRMGMSIPFNGSTKVTIPRYNIGMSTGNAAWVGEAGVIPVVKGTLTGLSLTREKVGAIIPASEELIRSAVDPGALAVFRRMLLRFLGNLLDVSLLDNVAAVAGVRPAGLLNGATTAAGTAGGGIGAVQADIKAMIGTFITNRVGQRPVLLVNPAVKLSLGMLTTTLGEMIFRDEIAQNRLLGLEIIASEFVPATTVILVDAAHFASAYDTPELEESAHATLTMADADGTAPTQAMDAGGDLGTAHQVPADLGLHVAGNTAAGTAVTGYKAVNMFQTWSRAVRCVIPAAYGMTQTGAVVTRTAVTW